jgi:hypothetical protein
MREPIKLMTLGYLEPKEALAVWELLNELANTLWDQHQLSFMQLLCEQQTPDSTDHDLKDSPKSSQLDRFELDDDLPF